MKTKFLIAFAMTVLFSVSAFASNDLWGRWEFKGGPTHPFDWAQTTYQFTDDTLTVTNTCILDGATTVAKVTVKIAMDHQFFYILENKDDDQQAQKGAVCSTGVSKGTWAYIISPGGTTLNILLDGTNKIIVLDRSENQFPEN